MHRRPPILALTTALLLSACSGPNPTLSPTSAAPTASATSAPSATIAPPTAAVYAAIRSAVEAIRGLQPTAAVDPVTIDEAQLVANFTAEFDRTRTAQQVKDAEDLLIALGLLPKGSSLRALTLDFQAGQVAGYYDPEKNELFVVSRSGGVGPAKESTYAHEFTHQLQDQHVDLAGLGTDAVDQTDRALARLALIEGDASSVQTAWMAANLTPKELGEVLAAALDPAAVEALQRAPAYLRDTSLFPYQDGLAFVHRLTVTGGYPAVDAAFADPPNSTEQVLHPDRYLKRDPPIEVVLPANLATSVGAGWTEAAQDTLGELILRIWLRQGGVPSVDARVATAGWGGDRLALLRGPDDALALELLTAWDTPADAAEFLAAANLAVANLGLNALVRGAGSGVSILVGDAGALEKLDEALEDQLSGPLAS